MNKDTPFHPKIIDFDETPVTAESDLNIECYWCPLKFKTRAKLIAHYNRAHRDVKA